MPSKDNGLISTTTKLKHPRPEKYIEHKYDQYKDYHNPNTRYDSQWLNYATRNYLEPEGFHLGYRPGEYRSLRPILTHARQNHNFRLHSTHMFPNHLSYVDHIMLPEIVLPAGVNPISE